MRAGGLRPPAPPPGKVRSKAFLVEKRAFQGPKEAFRGKSSLKWAKRGVFGTLKCSQVGVDFKTEAEKRPFNSSQEYYHPTKYGPQPTTLALLMSSVGGCPVPWGGVRLRSGPVHGGPTHMLPSLNSEVSRRKSNSRPPHKCGG